MSLLELAGLLELLAGHINNAYIMPLTCYSSYNTFSLL